MLEACASDRWLARINLLSDRGTHATPTDSNVTDGSLVEYQEINARHFRRNSLVGYESLNQS